MYRLLFRALLSRLDPELAHNLAFAVIRFIAWSRIGLLLRRATRPHPSLAIEALGTTFESPFGVAAGFDKDGRAIRGLWQLGFGHIEVGTLTGIPQPGNERPRMFRLVADRAVINRMGFNNRGSADAVARLAREQRRRGNPGSSPASGSNPALRGPIVGANIGKSRIVDVENATDDYLVSARRLAPVCDYLAVNVSSPNTPGLRGLQEIDRLAPLLTAVRDAAGSTPVLVKIAPDLSDDEVTRISQLVGELKLSGIIATNTTIARDGLSADARELERMGPGGVSGAPLAARSLAVLRLIRSVVPAELCVISVGGVETADDVAERLAAGATLVQGYTGFIYRGPFWASQINRALASRLASAA